MESSSPRENKKERMNQTMTDHVHARELSCAGLSMVDPTTDPLTFRGEPVDGYHEEVARRGGDLIYGCAVGGCYGDHPSHGDPSWQ